MKITELLLEGEGDSLFYFAYGMLTDPKFMSSATMIGVAELKNFEFVLYAYANVEPATGSSVSGTLWKIDRALLKELDEIEGYPSLYDRRTYPVYVDGIKYPAEIYLMTPKTISALANTIPTKEYIKTVARGYLHAGISTDQLEDAISNLYHDEPVTVMETDNINTITLNQLYQNEMPDDNEQIHDYGTMIWNEHFEIHKITAHELDFALCHQYDVESIEDLFSRMTKQQHKIIDKYIKDPNLSSYIIVMDSGYIVDGNHRAIAAALTKKSLRYIDLSEEEN